MHIILFVSLASSVLPKAHLFSAVVAVFGFAAMGKEFCFFLSSFFLYQYIRHVTQDHTYFAYMFPYLVYINGIKLHRKQNQMRK